MPYSLRNPTTDSGAVAAFDWVRVSANRNSFQAAMNTNTPVATYPPVSSGSIMLRNT